jgi:uncharacterized protein (TIGR03435 family)
MLMPAAGASAQNASKLPSKFDAASIKAPNSDEKEKEINSSRWQSGRFTAIDISVERLIETAYGLRSQQLEGLPNWAKSQGYTIQAAMPSDMPQFTPQQIPQVRHRMLQSLLRDRFALKLHKKIELLPVYEIVVAKGGPRLAAHNEDGRGGPGVTGVPPNEFRFVGVPIQFLAGYLSMYAGRIVIDKSGLTGRYDFTLKGVSWSPDPTAAGSNTESGANLSGESIFTAMKDQLGLELKAAKYPMTVFVVDHVESPTPN